MQGTQEEIDSAISALVENKLLEQIRVIYEDITTSSETKRKERAKATNKFVKICVEELLIPEDRIRNIINNVIEKAKWIEEIEELDEDFEEER